MNVHDSERLAGLLEAAGYRKSGRWRGRRRRRVQHLRGARKRRQQAVRKYQPSGAAQAGRPRYADRGRRLSGSEGPRRGAAAGAVGGRRVRHPQHRVAADAARPCPPQPGRPGGDRRGAGGVPVRPARGARVRLCRMGVGLRRLQQHLHVLHRARVARQGGRPATRRRSRRSAPRSSIRVCSR